jgi:hypothetical protein
MYNPNKLNPDPKKNAEARIKSSISRVRKKYLIRKASQNTIPKLKKKLWEVFSAYIRARDSKDGVFACISCGLTQCAMDGNLQAGHYFKSEMYPGIRYHEWNVWGQCKKCNLFREGNRQGYEEGLLKRIGKDKLDILKSMKNNKVKWGRFEYDALIEEYVNKLKNLAK